MEYVFYYYWHLKGPSVAKGTRDKGELVGGGPHPIEGAVWVITKEEFDNTSMIDLTLQHPWPFGVGNSDA